MIFLEKLYALLDTFDSASCKVRDQAKLYGVFNFPPPLAEHIVFLPMPNEIMLHMIEDYKRPFPKELLTLYRTMNGADLFWTVRFAGKKKTRIPINLFSIYGVPLTHDRKHIEPFNIRIEDLNRPDNTPDNWLKFGSYYSSENTTDRLDLFVDTDSNCVFSVKHENTDCCVTAKWNSVDDCLCSVFDIVCRTD